MKKYTLKNLDCASCASKIEDNLTKLGEVKFVTVNFANSTMTIDTDNLEKVNARIKEKKEAELEVSKQRIALDFIVEKQKKESERLVIESEAIKKSQDMLNSSLTDKLIQFKALVITRDLVRSTNAKIIITDGKSPVILNDK